MRRGGRARARRALRRLRRGRRRGPRCRQELLGVCRAAGMRLVGPNCLGVINTAPPARRHLRARAPARRGGSRSRRRAARSGSCDRRGDAPRPRAVLVRLDGQQGRPVGQRLHPLTGSRTRTPTRSCSTSSPSAIRAASAASPAGLRAQADHRRQERPLGRRARAASSHTGALLAASDVTVDALFAHAGVIRTETVSEQLDVAALLASQPLPRGNRVAIVTNAGGPGIACADACAAAGLRVSRCRTRPRTLRRAPSRARGWRTPST